MSALPLKSQYRPSLGELVGPRWRRWSALQRGLVLGLAVLVVGIAFAVALTVQDAAYSRGGTAPFSFRYRGLYRVAPDPGYFVKIARPRSGTPSDFFEVAPLHLPPYTGSANAMLPLAAADRIRERQATVKGFDLQGEGRFRGTNGLAYSISYAAKWNGQEMYIREILVLPPTTAPRDGLDVVLATRPSDTITADAPVGTTGPLQLPLRSVTVG